MRRSLLALTLLLAVVVALPLAGGAARRDLPDGKAAEFGRNPATLPVPAAVAHVKRNGPAAAAEPAWRSGIVESGRAPFSESQFVIENQWQDVVGGRHVNVYAGAEAGDPAQGVLVLQTSAPDGSASTPPLVIRTPQKHGALTLMRGGGMLTARAADGTAFSFDVARKQLRAGG